jgi:hypothetical protein
MTSQDDQMRVILLEAGLNTRQRGRTVMARSIVLLVLKFIKVENHLLLSMAVEDNVLRERCFLFFSLMEN